MNQKPKSIKMTESARASERGVVIFRGNKIIHVKYETQKSTEQKKKPQSEDIILNMYQNTLYLRLTKGLDAYSADELKLLSEKQKSEIQNKSKIAKFVINKTKVNVYYASVNKLVSAIFSEYNIGSKMNDYYALRVPIEITSSNLGISKKDIINLFIKHRLLPSNFFNIKPLNPPL